MLSQLHDCIEHGYNLGKRCAILADRYSPHDSAMFNGGADRIRNRLRDQGEGVDFNVGVDFPISLCLAGVWRAAYDFGVEEVRQERKLVEPCPAKSYWGRHRGGGSTNLTNLSRKPSISVEQRERDLERVVWV